MKIQCRYCGSMIEDTLTTCPNCAAPNVDMQRYPDLGPKTIEELKEFCEKHNIPLEKMRFFIGIDYKEPRAFGIYQDGENFIVYKNKANGERSIRYSGLDEAYAVVQILSKLKEEIALRKAKSNQSKDSSYAQLKQFDPSVYANTNTTSTKRKKKRNIFAPMMVLFVSFFSIQIVCYLFLFYTLNFSSSTVPTRGYYFYNDTYYFQYGTSWYYYDSNENDWIYDDYYERTPTFDMEPVTYYDFYNNYGDNGYGTYDYDYYYGDNGTGTNYDIDWSSSWDSDDDWKYDYDSWDSWDTDWDSDW